MNDKERDWEYLLREELYERHRERHKFSQRNNKEREKHPRKPWSKKSKSEKAWDIGCFGLIAIAFLSVCVGAIVRAIGE